MTARSDAASPGTTRTVRQRFSKMNIVKWKVSCVAPTVTQSFKLVFQDTNPPILGDNTFKDVPVGIDPTAWPLDVNIEYTTEMSKRDSGAVTIDTVLSRTGVTASRAHAVNTGSPAATRRTPSSSSSREADLTR